MSSERTIALTNPNKGIVEDRKQTELFSTKHIQLVLARTKMILIYWEWFLDLDLYIF